MLDRAEVKVDDVWSGGAQLCRVIPLRYGKRDYHST